MPPRLRQRGFSLIELLAAFVVFAIGFGVMMEITSSSLRNARRAAEQTEAALWAQSLIDALGVDEKLKVGADSGKFDDHYRWDLQVSEWEPPADAARFEGTSPIEMYRIELVVRWGPSGAERSSRFVTVRAVQPGVNG
ncbi:MAG: prepilin-type N-terminal cleavage/methylation domain-containing protein [Xanthomonadales bacterium]|nr:prepilin-type N-terminal cleavage/methylation domain-containing protein [Xanthomonadales bacterium]